MRIKGAIIRGWYTLFAYHRYIFTSYIIIYSTLNVKNNIFLTLAINKELLQFQVAADESRIVAVHSRGSVIQRGQKIRPNVSDFGF